MALPISNDALVEKGVVGRQAGDWVRSVAPFLFLQQPRVGCQGWLPGLAARVVCLWAEAGRWHCTLSLKSKRVQYEHSLRAKSSRGDSARQLVRGWAA
jgi:hypothetical protein